MPPTKSINFKRFFLYLSLLLLGGVFLGPLVTYATLTLDSTSITTDDTLKLKGGNVGVGNITPTSNLHVSGTLNVTATSTAAALSISGASTLTGALTLSNPSTNSLIYTNSTGVVTALASSTAGKILTASGTAPYFSWETTGSLTNLTLTGPSTNSPIYLNSAGLIASLASSTAGKVLMATSTAPYFSWETDATGGTVSTLVADGNNEITVGSTTSALTVNIANAPLSAAQTINIGSGSTGATSTSINIGGGTGANTINIATGATNAKTINIGTGASILNIINFGSASSTVNLPGSLGVGITSPSTTLHVSGTFRFVDGNQGAGKSLYSDASGGATWQTASTTEYAYNESSTNFTVSNATTTIVTASAVTFDGSTPVVIQFFSPRVALAAGLQGVTFSLFDGSSVVSWLGYIQGATGADQHDVPVFLSRRLTPSAASHTYSIRAITSSGNATVTCGAGSGEAHPPCFIRIIKAN